VTMAQLKYLSFDVDERYKPLKPESQAFGIVMLKDTKPEATEDFVSPASTPSGSGNEEEPQPPQPFEFDPDKE